MTTKHNGSRVELVLIGINHNTAPIEVRERLAAIAGQLARHPRSADPLHLQPRRAAHGARG